eukprot:11186884-Lingulodinium_polyedra.AAC.1
MARPELGLGKSICRGKRDPRWREHGRNRPPRTVVAKCRDDRGCGWQRLAHRHAPAKRVRS